MTTDYSIKSLIGRGGPHAIEASTGELSSSLEDKAWDATSVSGYAIRRENRKRQYLSPERVLHGTQVVEQCRHPGCTNAYPCEEHTTRCDLPYDSEELDACERCGYDKCCCATHVRDPATGVWLRRGEEVDTSWRNITGVKCSHCHSTATKDSEMVPGMVLCLDCLKYSPRKEGAPSCASRQKTGNGPSPLAASFCSAYACAPVHLAGIIGVGLAKADGAKDPHLSVNLVVRGKFDMDDGHPDPSTYYYSVRYMGETFTIYPAIDLKEGEDWENWCETVVWSCGKATGV